VLGTGVLLGTVLLGAAPAGASLTGACQASGTLISAGTPTRTYNPKVVNAATVPRTGNVEWRVSTGVSGDRAATGKVGIKFPPPVGIVTLGEWGKNGKQVGRPGNSGVYHYDLPSLLAGIKVPVTGDHHEPGINCAGTVVVQIKGRSPLVWVSLVLTVVRARGRPILGAVNGLFLALFLSADLLFFGVIRLDSVVVTILVAAGIVSGFVLGWWGPLASRDRN
jgi:hypothetical protein